MPARILKSCTFPEVEHVTSWKMNIRNFCSAFENIACKSRGITSNLYLLVFYKK